MGETSAATRASRPRGEGHHPADGRGPRAVAGADAAPARDVGRGRQGDQRQGAGVERPRSVRSHCAGLSQSRGRGVTRSAHHRRVLAAVRQLLARCSGLAPRAARDALAALGSALARRAGTAVRRWRPASPCAGRAGPSCASCAATRCPRCGLPAPCAGRCSSPGSALARAWAPVAFEGPARALVHALKFRGALGVADAMAAQIVAGAPPGLLAAPAALVPVPTHPLRRRVRGFDHAGAWPPRSRARSGLVVTRCLARGGAPTRQAGASRAARRAPGRIDVRRAAIHLLRRVGRRCAHHRRHARGVRFGAATSGRLRGVCGRLCAGVEMT